MYKISVIGICGKSTFMYVDHFHEKGETLIATSVHEEIGGKGINQAIAAARMGAEVSFLAAIGDDENGEECKKTLKLNNVKADLMKQEGKLTTYAFILTDKYGENYVTEYKGAELCEEDVLKFEKEIASSDVLLIQQEVPIEVNEAAIRIAKRHNIKVILNPAPIRKISDEIAQTVFLVTPNEQEKKGINTEKFKNCITTLGKKGCIINDKILVEGIKIDAVDTTGAGDTFNGVLAVCIAEGMNLEKSCKYAVTAAGISVGKRYVLDAIPMRNEIERIMNNE